MSLLTRKEIRCCNPHPTEPRTTTMCIFLFLLFSRTTSIGSRITALPLCTGRLGLVDFFAAQLYGAANTKNTRKKTVGVVSRYSYCDIENNADHEDAHARKPLTAPARGSQVTPPLVTSPVREKAFSRSPRMRRAILRLSFLPLARSRRRAHKVVADDTRRYQPP